MRFAVLAAILLSALLGACSAEDGGASNSSTQAASTDAPSTSSKRHHLFGGHLSFRKYDKIQNGMTYEEVVDILGRDGEEQASAGDATTGTAKIYTWQNISGSSVTVEFQDGAVVGKAQAGL